MTTAVLHAEIRDGVAQNVGARASCVPADERCARGRHEDVLRRRRSGHRRTPLPARGRRPVARAHRWRRPPRSFGSRKSCGRVDVPSPSAGLGARIEDRRHHRPREHVLVRERAGEGRHIGRTQRRQFEAIRGRSNGLLRLRVDGREDLHVLELPTLPQRRLPEDLAEGGADAQLVSSTGCPAQKHPVELRRALVFEHDAQLDASIEALRLEVRRGDDRPASIAPDCLGVEPSENQDAGAGLGELEERRHAGGPCTSENRDPAPCSRAVAQLRHRRMRQVPPIRRDDELLLRRCDHIEDRPPANRHLAAWRPMVLRRRAWGPQGLG